MWDYNLLNREMLGIDQEWGADIDLFISAYNSSDRVNHVFSKCQAKLKQWLILPDYEYDESEYPSDTGEFGIAKVFTPSGDSSDEHSYVLEFLDKTTVTPEMRLCIDITGFVKPYMMTLIAALALKGVKTFDVLFSEPINYKKRHKTKFSGENIIDTRQVGLFEGVDHNTTGNNDILIIGSGYDDALIKAVAEKKKSAKRKIQIFGFPSLKADMYQENILRAHLASDSVDPDFILKEPHNYLAPANDPFATASVLRKIKTYYEEQNPDDELGWYLCPLATKSQALGFVIFYLTECINERVSIIYPVCKTHSRDTADGVSRIWKYSLEFPQ